MESDRLVAIIGAGPAGLTAAYLLRKKGVPVVVLEADPTYVGGISRTVNFKGFHFDIGGHRFFSKSKEIEDLWSEILPGDDMLERPRSSKIYYRGQFFSYPLKAGEALLKLGIGESILCLLSYARARCFPVRNPQNFQDWVSNQFGERLFRIFFKTYTEKVWGIPCTEISVDWAAQRIKGLSLSSAILAALFPKSANRKDNPAIKTLIDSFRYPKLGPGMMWERCAERIREMDGEIRMGRSVTGCKYDSETRSWTVTAQTKAGDEEQIQASHVISTAAIRQLATMLEPELPVAVAKNASQLHYRDFITVAVILKDRKAFNEQWIYIHDPSVQVGRVQNFKAWSPYMSPDPELTCYGLEYFCFERETGFWVKSDEELKALAKQELEALGLAKPEDFIDATVVRQKKAYPVYDETYSDHVAAVRKELETNYPGLFLIGRNGMHKYNNQDHSMMTAMLSVENILADETLYDIWRVNEDAEYIESGDSASTSGLRQVPRRTR